MKIAKAFTACYANHSKQDQAADGRQSPPRDAVPTGIPVARGGDSHTPDDKPPLARAAYTATVSGANR